MLWSIQNHVEFAGLSCNATCAHNSCSQPSTLYQPQVTAKNQGRESGKRGIYFTQPNKDPLSTAVPQQSLATIIDILVEPIYQKPLHKTAT